MKKVISIVTLFLITATSFAQDINTSSSYKTAVGVKVYPGAITVKHFLNDHAAVEGIGYFYNGFKLTGLYELHGNINGLEGLKWYIGPGAHIGFDNVNNDNSNNGIAVGIDGIIGLDYKITGAPINISFDWQPSFNFITDSYFKGYGGLAFRFTF
jgi:hypothetical protein